MFESIKSVLYRSGTMGAYHRYRNKRHVTVVMFHRVLSRSDSRWAHSDPEWTVSDKFFEECLDFFGFHYNVMSTSDLIGQPQPVSRLMERPLLITFDDGWADVCDYALPALRRRSFPAVVFVVAGEVDGSEPWQDTVRRAWRQEQLTFERLPWLRAYEIAGTGERMQGQSPLLLSEWIDWLSGMAIDERSAFLERLRMDLHDETPKQMMSREQILQASISGCQIGSHGLTHTSLPISHAPWDELAGARGRLASMLEKEGDTGPVFFAFPNGRCDDATLRMAAAAGYRGLFTSEPCLNILPSDHSRPLVLGRINIPFGTLSDDRGSLRPELLAHWLFSRPARSIPWPEGRYE
jgi:peptidoglycan/xylan/chitin deacetylase (PgdA/CDA1 family)